MARYYTVILLVNIIFAAVLYFKGRNFGLSPRGLFYMAGLSALIGLVFPTFIGILGIPAVILINIVIVIAGTYLIDRVLTSGDEKLVTDGSILEQSLLAVATADITRESRREEELFTAVAEYTGEVTEEEEPVEFVESVEEELTEEELTEEELTEEELTEEELTEEELTEEEITEEEITEEEMTEEEITEDEITEDEITEEELPEEELTGEDGTGEVVADTGPVETDDSDVQGEKDMGIEHLRIEDDAELRDSYVTRGFEAKGEGKLDLAVKYFSSAMELNPPLDLEVMLVFDVCAMLRELGQYQKARDCLQEFAGARANILLPVMAEEIKVNLKYMEILQETLSKANTPSLPFSKVPALIVVSVEEKLNQWKNEVL